MDNKKKHIIKALTSKQEIKSGFTIPKNYFKEVENHFFDKLLENKLPKETGFKTSNQYFNNLEDTIVAKLSSSKKEIKVIFLRNRLRKIVSITAAVSILLFISIYYLSHKTTTIYWENITIADVNDWYENTYIDNTELTLVYENIDENQFLNTTVANTDIQEYFNTIDTYTIINEIQ